MSFIEALALAGVCLVVLAVVAASNGIWTNALIRLLWTIRQPFSVGETVSIGPQAGTVERLGWQAVYLHSAGGERVAIPNRLVLGQAIVQTVTASGTQGVELRLALPPGIKPAVGRRVAWQAVAISPYLDIRRPISVSLEQGGDGQMLVRVQAGIFDAGLRALFETSVIESYRNHLG